MTATRPRRPIGTDPVPAPKRERVPRPRAPRPARPRLSLPRLPRPSLSLPNVSLRNLSLPRVALPRPSVSLRRHEPQPTSPATLDEVAHPRIQRRRAEVAGARTRTVVRRVVGIGGALVLTAGAAGLFFTPALDVDRISVSGVEGPAAVALARRSALRPGEAMIGVDAAAVRDRLEALPWVAHASVRLDWPDEVELGVTAQRAVAALRGPEGSDAFLLTGTGEALSVDQAGPIEVPARTILLDVPPDELGRSERLELLAVLDALGPAATASLGELRRRGERITFEGTGAIDGAEVVWGGAEEVASKAQALEATLGGQVDLDCVATLDVSVPPRVTLRRSCAS